MKMKFKCAAAVAAILVGAPLVSVAGPDAKKADPPAKEAKQAKDAKPAKEKEAKEPEKAQPTEAEIAKARKAKRPVYTKAEEALNAAEMCNQPLAVFFLLDDSRSIPSQTLERKMLGDKRFKDDYAKSNLVLLKFKLKPDFRQARGRGRNSNYQKVEMPRKGAGLSLLEQFGLDPKYKARTPNAKHDDKANYPAVVVIAPNGKKQLFRITGVDKSGGFGAWLSTFDGHMRGASIEPVVSAAVQKVLDNPTEPKKWK